LSQKDVQFSNGNRILTLAAEVEHISDYAIPLKEAIEAGQYAYDRAASVTVSLEHHRVLEEEVKTLRANIKGIENNRDGLVQSAREKISTDAARTVIIERLRKTLMEIYETYLRADQRACVRSIENLWEKYAVTAREIEGARDLAAQKLQGFLVELGYE
jgi:type I restriction enzyme M protein